MSSFTRTITLAMLVLHTATISSVDGFTFGAKPRTSKKTTASSPLLDEALSIYPFAFRPEGESSGTKTSCSVAFNELARLYGDDEALAMVKLEPRSVRFDSDNFGPCLDAWEEQFGLESARAMVGRNPGLLGVASREAEQPAEASMALSYLVAATRPLPKIAAVGGILAILTAGLR